MCFLMPPSRLAVHTVETKSLMEHEVVEGMARKEGKERGRKRAEMTWMHGSYCPPPEQERKLLLVAFLRSLPAFQTSAAAQWRLAAATDHRLLVLYAFTTVPKVNYMHPESIIVYIHHRKSKATRHACLFLSRP